MSQRSITTKGFLEWLGAEAELFFPMDRKGAYKRIRGQLDVDIDDYFPIVLKRATDQLERKGLVEKVSTKEGILVKITDRGKSELLKYDLLSFKPKTGKWDGKWRMVFFDVPELNRKRRETLRMYLKRLGLVRIQDSVFVTPHDVFSEIRYMREVLDIPNGVKMAVVNWIENEDDLKTIFDLD